MFFLVELIVCVTHILHCISVYAVLWNINNILMILVVYNDIQVSLQQVLSDIFMLNFIQY